MRRLFLLAAFFILCAYQSPECAAQSQDYCADVVTKAQGQTIAGKMFVSKNKVRIESPQVIIISRMDKNTGYLLMPDQKMYMEQPIDNRTHAVSAEKQQGEIERILVGKEAINGRMAEKYKITGVDALGTKSVMYQWIDTSINIPVKTVAEDNSWSTECSNIKVGAVVPSVFEVPADYKKFAVMPTNDIRQLISERMPENVEMTGE